MCHGIGSKPGLESQHLWKERVIIYDRKSSFMEVDGGYFPTPGFPHKHKEQMM